MNAEPDALRSEEPEAPETPAENTKNPGPFAVKSPLDGSALDPVVATNPSEVPALARKAREAQRAWGELSARERASIVAKVKPRLLSRAAEIADVLHRECGKPIEEAVLSEVIPNGDLIEYWTSSIEELLEGT